MTLGPARTGSGVRRRALTVAALVAVLVAPLAATLTTPATGSQAVRAAPDPDAVPSPASCAKGARPEPGIQGRVPRTHRDSGRSTRGYWCNLRLVGQRQDDGGAIVSAVYGHCSYTGSFSGTLSANGVEVLDVSDPARPRVTETLMTPAMRTNTWETLKVNERRGLLAAVGVPVLPGLGAGQFDLYDIKTDCEHPRLLNKAAGGNTSKPLAVVGHEGAFAPDGRTYYSTSAYGGLVTAVDVADPRNPKVVWTGAAGLTNHGLSLSKDGNTMYAVSALPAGIQILDVSDIQERKAVPMVRQISSLSWGGKGLFTQATIPFVDNGRQMLVVFDEAGTGGIRFVDIQDPAEPKVVRRMLLGIQLPNHQAQRAADVGGDGLFGYEAHYCNLDRPRDPTALACGYFQSGIRVFDIRNLRRPREIAYFNPPAQSGKTIAQLGNSAHALITYAPPLLSYDSLTLGSLVDSLKPDLTADWCMSPPFFKPRLRQLWVTCNDNGFLTLKFARGVFPVR